MNRAYRTSLIISEFRKWKYEQESIYSGLMQMFNTEYVCFMYILNEFYIIIFSSSLKKSREIVPLIQV